MKFIHGKRQFRQERMFGFVLVTEERVGIRTFGLIFNRTVWGVQWLMRRKNSGNGSKHFSPKSGRNTANR